MAISVERLYVHLELNIAYSTSANAAIIQAILVPTSSFDAIRSSASHASSADCLADARPLVTRSAIRACAYWGQLSIEYWLECIWRCSYDFPSKFSFPSIQG